MNTLETYKLEDEELKGFFRGIVIQNADGEQLRRIKVRVRGVYDEPVKKEHIPWAVPMVRNSEVPQLGDECVVMFQDGDVGQPTYLPVQWLGLLNIERLQSVYGEMVQKKKDTRETNIDTAGESWEEPETESDSEDLSHTKQIKILPEDVSSEQGEEVDLGDPKKGFIVERNNESGKEMESTVHPSGTYREVQKTGTVLEHSQGDRVEVTKGDEKQLVKGNLLQKVLGYVKKQFVGALTLKIEGATTLNINGAEITVDATGNVTIDSKTGKVQVKGTQFQANGTVVPDGTGPFCGLPFCVFSGAPQTGKISLNN